MEDTLILPGRCQEFSQEGQDCSQVRLRQEKMRIHQLTVPYKETGERENITLKGMYPECYLGGKTIMINIL